MLGPRLRNNYASPSYDNKMLHSRSHKCGDVGEKTNVKQKINRCVRFPKRAPARAPNPRQEQKACARKRALSFIFIIGTIAPANPMERVPGNQKLKWRGPNTARCERKPQAAQLIRIEYRCAIPIASARLRRQLAQRLDKLCVLDGFFAARQ